MVYMISFSDGYVASSATSALCFIYLLNICGCMVSLPRPRSQDGFSCFCLSAISIFLISQLSGAKFLKPCGAVSSAHFPKFIRRPWRGPWMNREIDGSLFRFPLSVPFSGFLEVSRLSIVSAAPLTIMILIDGAPSSHSGVQFIAILCSIFRLFLLVISYFLWASVRPRTRLIDAIAQAFSNTLRVFIVRWYGVISHCRSHRHWLVALGRTGSPTQCHDHIVFNAAVQA